MNQIHEITSISDPAIAPYASLTEAQLRNRLHPDESLFIVESPKVIRVALDAGMEPVSLLCERRHITGDAADIIARCPGVPVYTGDRDVLARLTGYTLTRGVLCAMRRPCARTYIDICRNARRVVVIDGVVDTTNIGAIFRSAAALGIDGVLLTPQSCDPLNRRAVRVSMGSVFLVPWSLTPIPSPVGRGGVCSPAESLPLSPEIGEQQGRTWMEDLRSIGFKTVAMALTDRSVSIDDPQLCAEPRLAIVMGTEGDGLAQEVIDACDYTARIPMSHGVDSLNVAAAAAVAFWQLRAR